MSNVYSVGAIGTISGSIPTGGRAGQNAMYAMFTSCTGARLVTVAVTVIVSIAAGDVGRWESSETRRPDSPPRATVPTSIVKESETIGPSFGVDTATTNQTSVPSGKPGTDNS